jgi:hypothetical protein
LYVADKPCKKPENLEYREGMFLENIRLLTNYTALSNFEGPWLVTNADELLRKYINRRKRFLTVH